jgi:hypothetical protein
MTNSQTASHLWRYALGLACGLGIVLAVAAVVRRRPSPAPASSPAGETTRAPTGSPGASTPHSTKTSTAAQLAETQRPRADPVPPIPPPLRRQGRPKPARFSTVSPPSTPGKVLDTGTFAHEHPALSSAFGNFSIGLIDSDGTKLRQCAGDLVARKPQEATDEIVTGAVAVTIQVQGGQARVIAVKPLRGADPEFAECWSRDAESARTPFVAPGAQDGTVTFEWPYKLRAIGRGQ